MPVNFLMYGMLYLSGKIQVDKSDIPYSTVPYSKVAYLRTRVRSDHAKTAPLVTLKHRGWRDGPSLSIHLLLFPRSRKKDGRDSPR